MKFSHSGRASSTNPPKKFRCKPSVIGTVSAMTFPPFEAAMSPASNFFLPSSRVLAFIFKTFQLSGLLAATDMSAIKSIAHCSNGPSAGINSIDVPSKSESTSQRAMSSLLFAYRLGTIFPNGSLCVLDHDDENPKPPASSPKRSNSCIANNSSAVASRSVAAVPITTLLRAL